VNQLTQYTDGAGQPSTTRTTSARLGPYLTKWPTESISGLGTVTINTTNERILSAVSTAVATGTGTGGWYYESRSGNIVANLGRTYSAVYAGF
jgi:hypothetical protein